MSVSLEMGFCYYRKLGKHQKRVRAWRRSDLPGSQVLGVESSRGVDWLLCFPTRSVACGPCRVLTRTG